MFSRRVVIYLVLIVLLAALLPLILFREPSYQGRSLSDWLEHAHSSIQRTNDVGDSRMAQAVTAVRAIGPKAIPHLLGMLSAKETSLGELGRELRKSITRRDRDIPPPWQLQRRGFLGLQILGPAAAPAVPKILKMLEQDPDRMDLWFLLENIGPASAPAEPLLARAFPHWDKKSDLEPRWLQNDFHPRWLASDLLMTWGGSHRERLLDHLSARTNSLIQRVSCLWSLRKDRPYARQFVPTIASIIAHPAEPPLLKIACLHALGRIPDVDPNLLARAVEQYESQFHPLPVAAIANGDFTQSHWSGTNQIPGDSKAPHALYTNWFTWNGVIGRNLSNGWTGPKIELGPRSPPGSISQVFRTTPGAAYQIQFEAANGRNFGVHLSVGDLDKTCIPSSSDPTKPSQFTFQFRAPSALTTLTFSGLEYDGYGPFIDNVVVTSDRKSD